MARGYNYVSLIGNVGSDPELRHTEKGTAVANASLAVNGIRKDGDDYVEEVTWVPLTFWGRNAEVFAEYCSKGTRLHIEGKFASKQYLPPEGKQMIVHFVRVVTMNILTWKGEQNNSNRTDRENDEALSKFLHDDECPF